MPHNLLQFLDQASQAGAFDAMSFINNLSHIVRDVLHFLQSMKKLFVDGMKLDSSLRLKRYIILELLDCSTHLNNNIFLLILPCSEDSSCFVGIAKGLKALWIERMCLIWPGGSGELRCRTERGQWGYVLARRGWLVHGFIKPSPMSWTEI